MESSGISDNAASSARCFRFSGTGLAGLRLMVTVCLSFLGIGSPRRNQANHLASLIAQSVDDDQQCRFDPAESNPAVLTIVFPVVAHLNPMNIKKNSCSHAKADAVL